jgi:hypothetical protein
MSAIVVFHKQQRFHELHEELKRTGLLDVQASATEGLLQLDGPNEANHLRAVFVCDENLASARPPIIDGGSLYLFFHARTRSESEEWRKKFFVNSRECHKFKFRHDEQYDHVYLLLKNWENSLSDARMWLRIEEYCKRTEITDNRLKFIHEVWKLCFKERPDSEVLWGSYQSYKEPAALYELAELRNELGKLAEGVDMVSMVAVRDAIFPDTQERVL